MMFYLCHRNVILAPTSKPEAELEALSPLYGKAGYFVLTENDDGDIGCLVYRQSGFGIVPLALELEDRRSVNPQAHVMRFSVADQALSHAALH